MPTHNRRSFVSKAIEYFLRQDYCNRELIIIDDGTDSISDLIPCDQRIRYLGLERRETIGAKRNLACREAKGEIIVHWDDDDWMADWRLGYQVNSLLSAQADLCGLDRVLFCNPGSGQSWQYVYPNGSTPWVAGGTFCYTKAFWRNNPFPDISVGEDLRFVWNDRPKKMLALQDNTFYVALIHSRNTSPKVTQGRRWQAYPITEIRRLVGHDWDYYVDLSQSGEEAGYSRRSNKHTRIHVSGGTGMKLNIGCCDAPMPGFVNVDIVPAPGVEAADLRQPWPWPDGSVEYIRAWDIIEHLPDKIFTMNELWRVLRPGGRAEIAIPTTEGPGAWQDPTHVSFWNRRSFMYYEAGNPYRERFAGFYGIQAKFRIVSERIDQSVDGPRLTIVLETVKEIAQWDGETEAHKWSLESNPDFHVVILSACASNLAACVRSVLNSEPGLPPDRIIVVDDGARSEAEHQLPGIRWVAGVKPFVFARNANLGILAAGTDVVLLNDDARLMTSLGFTNLSGFVRNASRLGVCSAGIKGVVGNPKQVATGTDQFRPEERDLAFICVYITKGTLDRVGLLDERFVGYGFDDNDYCARARAAGLQLGVWDGCVVDHSGELPSTFRTRSDLWNLFKQNQRLFRKKWGKAA